MVIKEIGGVARLDHTFCTMIRSLFFSPKAPRSFKQGKACVLDTTSDREGESSVGGTRPYAENSCNIQGRRLQWPEMRE